MSYGMTIVHTDPKNTKPILVRIPVEKQIGSCVCESSSGDIIAEFNITYNYYDYLKEFFGEKSIRSIYNKPLIEILKTISDAVSYYVSKYYPDQKYRDSVSGKDYKPEELDYYKSCPYNVVNQLEYMRTVIILVLEKEGNECTIVGD